MHVLFGIWGFGGLLYNGGMVFNQMIMHTGNGVGIGTSGYIGTFVLVWIGGLLLFGILALLQALWQLAPPASKLVEQRPEVTPTQDPAMAPLRFRNS